MNAGLLFTRNLRIYILILIVFALAVGGMWINIKTTNENEVRQAELRKLNLEYSQLVRTKWTINDVLSFLGSLPQSDLKELGDLTGEGGATAEQLAKHLMRLSSSAFTYPFKDKNNVNYHTEILLWAAQENEVIVTNSLSSYDAERLIMENKFEQIWEQLTPQQRTELLNKLKISGLSDNQKAALVAGSGAAAVTALSATVAFSGFAFYTTMSTAIATSASLLGIALPFSVYTGASSTVAVLSGPIGWSIALVAGTGAAIWATAPDADKTTAFILALHSYKAKRADEVEKQIQNLDGEMAAI